MQLLGFSSNTLRSKERSLTIHDGYFQAQYAVHRKSIRGILTAGVGKVRTSNKAL